VALKEFTAVILCGGEGLRFKNDHLQTSKVMALIEDKPIIWHIMYHYSQFGVNRFILCVRDDDSQIKEYFENFEDWNVSVIKTGDETPTGGRIKMIQPLIKNNTFFVTYGDGLADVNIELLLAFHTSKKALATLTAVRTYSQYGLLRTDNEGMVISFDEKPMLKEWVNGGFFVFSDKIFDILDFHKPLEESLISGLVSQKELYAFCHDGFWKSIDTYKDYKEAKTLISSYHPPKST
jgi:glucose-1-phosphate cytidylyltransferase